MQIDYKVKVFHVMLLTFTTKHAIIYTSLTEPINWPNGHEVAHSLRYI